MFLFVNLQTQNENTLCFWYGFYLWNCRADSSLPASVTCCVCKHMPSSYWCAHESTAVLNPFNWFVSAPNHGYNTKLSSVMIQSSRLSWRRSPLQALAAHPDASWAWRADMKGSQSYVGKFTAGLYFSASSQRKDCFVKSAMVKVNHQWPGYCVADWKGNYFEVKEGKFVFVCVCVLGCDVLRSALRSVLSVEGLSWQRVFQLTCQHYSAYRAVKWPTAGLTWGPSKPFQLFPSHCCSLNMSNSFSLSAALYSLSTLRSLLLSAVFVHSQLLFLPRWKYFSSDPVLDPFWIAASMRIT